MNVDIAALDTFLKHKHRALRLPGLAVAVVQDGRIVYLRGLGAAAPGQAMMPQTPLVIGSLSKSLTALAVIQLVEAGKIDLDTLVQHYIPWFRLADPVASSFITIRHLLTHTSGICRFAGRELLAEHEGKTIEQSVRELATLTLTQPVGAAFQYSNTNYLIAGLVVEVVAGVPFGTYLQQHIFRPLGMQHSYVSEQEAIRGGLAAGYRWWFGTPCPFDAPYLPQALPAAYVAASAEDMARYLLMLLGSGSLDNASVLSPDGIAALFRPQVPTAAHGSSYALGWRVETLDGVSVIRHGGEVSNFLAEMVIVPELRMGVVVLVNANNGLVPLACPQEIRVASSVARLLLEKPQLSSRLSPRGFYALLNITLAALSVYQVWSLVRALRPGQARQKNQMLPALAAIGEVGLLGIAAQRIPRQADAPWSLLRLYVPDVTSWLAVFAGGSLLKCGVLLSRLLRTCHRNR